MKLDDIDFYSLQHRPSPGGFQLRDRGNNGGAVFGARQRWPVEVLSCTLSSKTCKHDGVFA